jgi:hypothetical protein
MCLYCTLFCTGMFVRTGTVRGTSTRRHNTHTHQHNIDWHTFQTMMMDEANNPPGARALLPCLLPLNTLKQIRDQNLLLLEPVGTLKQLWIQECQENADTIRTEEEELLEESFHWKEYRLHGKPQSLKELLDLFLLENGEYDLNRAIWIPGSDAFVCIDQCRVVGRVRVPGAYREGVFEVSLSSDNNRCSILSVFSSTIGQAMPCLEFIFGLHDSHFQELVSSHNVVPGDDADEPPICPLTNRCLEKILIQNENRENTFIRMAFTLEQSRVLAASGTNIALYACRFPDGGVAFVDAARQHSSLTKLSFYERLPFEDIHFVWCLDNLNLEYLKLSSITFDDEQTCRAVATAEIDYLYLENCKFEDEEAVQALVDNVRAERGPKGLFLGGEPFESPERLIEFINALRGNTYRERLVIGNLDVRDGSFQALVAALPENRGLTHLGLMDCTANDRYWDYLMGAVAEHPSLRILSFEEIYEDEEDEDGNLLFERNEPIHALAGMLAVNEQVDEIQIDDSFDRTVWNAVVVPRLEINLYRKRFRTIQAIRLEKTRAAVMARGLARIALADVKSESSLIFMLLSQNCDVFCSYLDEILTRDKHSSVPSRKRSRLPSEDATGLL